LNDKLAESAQWRVGFDFDHFFGLFREKTKIYPLRTSIYKYLILLTTAHLCWTQAKELAHFGGINAAGQIFNYERAKGVNETFAGLIHGAS